MGKVLEFKGHYPHPVPLGKLALASLPLEGPHPQADADGERGR